MIRCGSSSANLSKPIDGYPPVEFLAKSNYLLTEETRLISAVVDVESEDVELLLY